MTRRAYRLNAAHIEVLREATKEASRPLVLQVGGFAGGRSLLDSRNAVNAAWAKIGSELGFNWKTVAPLEGMDESWFSAEPLTRQVTGDADPLDGAYEILQSCVDMRNKMDSPLGHVHRIKEAARRAWDIADYVYMQEYGSLDSSSAERNAEEVKSMSEYETETTTKTGTQEADQKQSGDEQNKQTDTNTGDGNEQQ